MTDAPFRLPLIAVCLLAGCGGGGSTAPAPAPAPAPPAAAAPALTLSIDQSRTAPGRAVTLSWSSMNASACNASGDWSGALAAAGSSSQIAGAPGQATYTVTCIGAGGSAVQSAKLAVAYPVMNTSYANTKGYGFAPIAFPAEAGGDGSPMVWAQADFYQSGSFDLFTANQNYGPDNVTEAMAKTDPRYLSDFAFWRRNADNSFTRVSSVKGCLHPRKAIVADFNQDGVPDVFVACHGYDAPPFPGERNKLLLSDGHGGFAMSDQDDAGFHHGAAAADVNGDGYPDIVVADNFKNPNVYFLINQKDGTFAADRGRIPGLPAAPWQGPYFSVELVDVNGDAVPDLLIGGHEQSGSAPTRILFGDRDGKFGANGAGVTLPPLAGRGVVLDFTLVSNGAKQGLYVNRTSDETSAEGFYGSQTLQWIDLAGLQSSVLLDVKGRWIPWWLPATRDGKAGVAPYSGKFKYFYAN